MHIEFAYFYFTLFIGIEMITTFIHSRSSLENHTQFQTKMGKVYTRFQTKTAKKTLPDGEAHTHIAYIREYPQSFWPVIFGYEHFIFHIVVA